MRLLALLAVVFVSVPAAAQTKEESTAKDPNKVICRNEEVIGSRLQTQRTCLTSQEWAQRRADQKRTVQRIQDFKSHQGG